MPLEIERKFLVRGDDWRTIATKKIHIRQAYLAADGKASIRIRVKNDREATLTVKSRMAERRRLELEYPVPVLEAEALIALRQGSIVEKHRYLIPFAGDTWEIDVFDGENAGLVIAELELHDENQRINLPPWAGPEVTGQTTYYNSSLALHPFTSWSREVRQALGMISR
jgi:adenylate cyclase